jgi:hypothetical protein
MGFMNLKFLFEINNFLRNIFLLDFFILIVMVFQCVVVKKIISLVFNSSKRKKSIMIIF